jgi:hypothetical protein
LRDEIIRRGDDFFDAWMEQAGWSDRYSDIQSASTKWDAS